MQQTRELALIGYSVFQAEGTDPNLLRRGEIVEDVDPPLPLTTRLLLVKPPAGLGTPEVFRALDLSGRSTADPLALLAGTPY